MITLWQEQLFNILTVVFRKSPILFLIDQDRSTTCNRSLLEEAEDTNFIVAHLMKDQTLYISNSNWWVQSNRVTFFRVHKSQRILCLLDLATVTSGTTLTGVINHWRRNAAWSGQALILVTITLADEVTSPAVLAKTIINEFWRQGKHSNIFVVIIGHHNFVEIYQSVVYTPSCNASVKKVTQIILREPIKNVNKCKIKAATANIPPYVYSSDPANPYSQGVEAMIFQSLASILNFTYEFIATPPGENAWAVSLNGRPVGLIGILHRQEADITFHAARLSLDRYLLADPLDPYYGGSFVWAAPLPGKAATWKLIYLVFPAEIWFSVIISLFFTSVIIWKLSQLDAAQAFLLAWGFTLKISSHYRILSQILKCYLALYLIYVVNLTAAFESNLFRIISHGVSLPAFERAMEALEHGFSASLFPTMIPILQESNPVMYEYLTSHGIVNWTADASGAFRRIAQQIPEIRLTTDLLLKYETNLRYTTPSNKQLVTALKERFSPYETVFYMSKDHPLLPAVKTAMRRLTETGWVSQMIETVIEGASAQRVYDGSLHSVYFDHCHELGLQQLLGAFALLIIILLISCVLFGLELMIASRKTKPSIAENE